MNHYPRPKNTDPLSAVILLDHISAMLERRKLAAELDISFGNKQNRLGPRLSLLDPQLMEQFQTQVNNALLSMNGIRTFLQTPRGGQLVTLVNWVGVDSENPEAHTWRAGEIRQGQYQIMGEVGVDFNGLRQELLEEHQGGI